VNGGRKEAIRGARVKPFSEKLREPAEWNRPYGSLAGKGSVSAAWLRAYGTDKGEQF